METPTIEVETALGLDVRYEPGGDYGRGVWKISRAQFTPIVDSKAGPTITAKSEKEVLAQIANVIPGWEAHEIHPGELSELLIVLKATPSSRLVLVPRDEGWDAKVEDVGSQLGQAFNKNPAEATIRALGDALAKGARWE